MLIYSSILLYLDTIRVALPNNNTRLSYIGPLCSIQVILCLEKCVLVPWPLPLCQFFFLLANRNSRWEGLLCVFSILSNKKLSKNNKPFRAV